jgi:alanine-alpha-ketoisovalerate/valine-pyruvate aminotransferase
MKPFYQGADALLIQSQARRQIIRPEGVYIHAVEGAKFASCFTLDLPLQTRRLRLKTELQVALATSS